MRLPEPRPLSKSTLITADLDLDAAVDLDVDADLHLGVGADEPVDGGDVPWLSRFGVLALVVALAAFLGVGLLLALGSGDDPHSTEPEIRVTEVRDGAQEAQAGSSGAESGGRAVLVPDLPVSQPARSSATLAPADGDVTTTTAGSAVDSSITEPATTTSEPLSSGPSSTSSSSSSSSSIRSSSSSTQISTTTTTPDPETTASTKPGATAPGRNKTTTTIGR